MIIWLHRFPKIGPFFKIIWDLHYLNRRLIHMIIEFSSTLYSRIALFLALQLLYQQIERCHILANKIAKIKRENIRFWYYASFYSIIRSSRFPAKYTCTSWHYNAEYFAKLYDTFSYDTLQHFNKINFYDDTNPPFFKKWELYSSF